MVSSAADNQRLILLCERLLEATRAGRAAWRIEGERAFVWEREEGSVAVSTDDVDGRPRYEVAVLNPVGEQVDELATGDGGAEAARLVVLAELHRVARRSALHADEVVDALLAALPAPSREGSPW